MSLLMTSIMYMYCFVVFFRTVKAISKTFYGHRADVQVSYKVCPTMGNS